MAILLYRNASMSTYGDIENDFLWGVHNGSGSTNFLSCSEYNSSNLLSEDMRLVDGKVWFCSFYVDSDNLISGDIIPLLGFGLTKYIGLKNVGSGAYKICEDGVEKLTNINISKGVSVIARVVGSSFTLRVIFVGNDGLSNEVSYSSSTLLSGGVNTYSLCNRNIALNRNINLSAIKALHFGLMDYTEYENSVYEAMVCGMYVYSFSNNILMRAGVTKDISTASSNELMVVSGDGYQDCVVVRRLQGVGGVTLSVDGVVHSLGTESCLFTGVNSFKVTSIGVSNPITKVRVEFFKRSIEGFTYGVDRCIGMGDSFNVVVDYGLDVVDVYGIGGKVAHRGWYKGWVVRNPEYFRVLFEDVHSIMLGSDTLAEKVMLQVLDTISLDVDKWVVRSVNNNSSLHIAGGDYMVMVHIDSNSSGVDGVLGGKNALMTQGGQRIAEGLMR